MQRVYMHSNEHFEVFTTVLAPQGESYHICRRVWRSMTLCAGECKVTWHLEIMNHFFVITHRLLLHRKAGLLSNCCPCILCEEILMRLCINKFFIFFCWFISLSLAHRKVSIQGRSREGKLNLLCYLYKIYNWLQLVNSCCCWAKGPKHTTKFFLHLT